MVKYVSDVSYVTPVRKMNVSHDLDRAREEIENTCIVQRPCVSNLTLNASKTSGEKCAQRLYILRRIRSVTTIVSGVA